MNSIKKRFWLKELIKEHGYTYEKLAEWLDVSRGTINNWIAGKTIPSPVATRLAEKFGKTVDFILTGPEPPPIAPNTEDLRERWNKLFDQIEPESRYTLLQYLEKTHTK